MRMTLPLWLLLGFMGLMAGSAAADDRPVILPPSPSSFQDRADAIVTVNACGRELDYLNIRAAMAKGDFSGEGEALLSILVAKTEWLRAGRRFPSECESTIQFPVAEEASWSQTTSPTHCAREKSRVTDGVNVTVSVSASADCMRRQLNDAIRAMFKNGVVGTGIACLNPFGSVRVPGGGEWDVNLRWLVRILYMGRKVVLENRQPLLEPETIEAMYENLLSASGPLGPASENPTSGSCRSEGEELGSPEDRADRHDWGNELLEGIADFFKWLVSFGFEFAAWTLKVAGASVIWPFVAATGGDVAPLFFESPEVAETENHRLQIETSRYLTNVDMIERLEEKDYGHTDELREENAEVRKWLLQRLQDIAAHDFIEYNSKPYTRYSLEATANLNDFGDAELKTAARIVLDLSAAKFAAGSNQGRRIVPYRRRADADGLTPGSQGSYLYNYQEGGDHEVARAIVLYGQTLLLEVSREVVAHGKKRQVRQAELKRHEIGQLVNAAVSSYRPPSAVLQMMKPVSPFAQRIGHYGVEQYEKSKAFTISAGGIHTQAAYTVLGFGEENDEGLAMPTFIIPTIAGLHVEDLFGFYGDGAGTQRGTNLCVWKGFACGIAPRLPALFVNCRIAISLSGDSTIFYNSKACFPALDGPHFYLAARVMNCDGFHCRSGYQWGLMEIIEAPEAREKDDPAFQLFRTQRQRELAASQLDAIGAGVYVAANGDRIGYAIDPATKAAKVVTVNGTLVENTWGNGSFGAGGDPLRASPINSDGQGHVSIVGPSGARVDIDFSDWANPKRSESP